MARTSDDLITAETHLVMALMPMGETISNVATYREACGHIGHALSADVYREHALSEIAKVRAALDKAEAVLVAMAPKKAAA